MSAPPSSTLPPTAVLLTEYFARIGFQGTPKADLQTLNEIIFAHVTSIPFENLDVLLDRNFTVDEASVFEKLVRSKRGGYCYEQNRLMIMVLLALGYDARSLSARVRWKKPKDQPAGRLHLFTLVTIDGEQYIVDVGVGLPTPTGAFKLSAEPQNTPHDLRRVIDHPELKAGWLMHQVWWDGAWRDLYEFTLDPCYMIDCEVGNWYVSKNPTSWFRSKLMCTRARADGSRIVLVDKEFTVRRAVGNGENKEDAVLQKTVVETGAELLAVLASEFGLVFPSGTSFAGTGAPVPS